MWCDVWFSRFSTIPAKAYHHLESLEFAWNLELVHTHTHTHTNNRLNFAMKCLTNLATNDFGVNRFTIPSRLGREEGGLELKGSSWGDDKEEVDKEDTQISETLHLEVIFIVPATCRGLSLSKMMHPVHLIEQQLCKLKPGICSTPSVGRVRREPHWMRGMQVKCLSKGLDWILSCRLPVWGEKSHFFGPETN